MEERELVYKNLELFSEDARVLVRSIMKLIESKLLFDNIVSKMDDTYPIKQEMKKICVEEMSLYLRYASTSIYSFYENPKKDIVNLRVLITRLPNYIKANKISLPEDDIEKINSLKSNFEEKLKSYRNIIDKCRNVRNSRLAHFVGVLEADHDIEEPSIQELQSIVAYTVNIINNLIKLFDFNDIDLGHIDNDFFYNHKIGKLKETMEKYGRLLLYAKEPPSGEK